MLDGSPKSEIAGSGAGAIKIDAQAMDKRQALRDRHQGPGHAGEIGDITGLLPQAEPERFR